MDSFFETRVPGKLAEVQSALDARLKARGLGTLSGRQVGVSWRVVRREPITDSPQSVMPRNGGPWKHENRFFNVMSRTPVRGIQGFQGSMDSRLRGDDIL